MLLASLLCSDRVEDLLSSQKSIFEMICTENPAQILINILGFTDTFTLISETSIMYTLICESGLLIFI